VADPTKLGVRLVLALAVVGIVIATVSSLTGTRSQLVGGNGIPPTEFAVQLPAGQRVCDPNVIVPAVVDAVDMTVGTYGATGQRLHLTVPGAGAGRTTVIGTEGVIPVPVPAGGSRGKPGLCIVNDGKRTLALAGIAQAPGLEIGGQASNGLVSFTFVDHEPGTWSDVFGDVLDQIGYAKGLPFGGIAGVVVLVLLLGALGGALAAGWRYLRP
jgi:hypothetical protein